MADAEKLAISLEARYTKAETDMKKFVALTKKKMGEAEAATKASALKMESSLGGAFSRAGGMLKTAFGAFLGVQGITAIFSKVEGAVKRFDDLGDAAKRLGTSAGALTQWQMALNDAGGDMESFMEAADAFQGKIGKVIAGGFKSKATTNALALLGLTKEDMAALPTMEARLLAIADALAKVADPAKKAAIADALGLRPLLPLLERGRVGVEKLTDAYAGMGRAADEGVKRTGDLGDKIVSLQKELQLKEDNLFVRLAPIIAGVYQQISNVLDLMGDPRFRAALAFTPAGFLFPMQPDTTNAPLARGAFRGAMADWKASHTPKPVPAADDPTLAGDPVVDAAAESAKRAREEYLALADARRNWRLDPSAKGEMRQMMEGISDSSTANMESKKIDPLSAANDATQRARAAWRETFGQFLYDLESGDIKGALVGLFDNITASMMQKASDYLADQLFDLVGGDTMTLLFDPLTTSQQAQAVAVDGTTTSFNVLTSAAYQLATAMQGASATGSASKGGLGDLLKAGLSLFAGSFGAAAAGGASASVGAGLAGFRASGGPVSAGALYGINERGAEPFIPAVDGRILSVPQAQAAMRGGGGGTTVNISIDARGATRDALPGIQREVADLKASLPRIIDGRVNDGFSRRKIKAA